MSARLSLEEIPYIAWKGKTFSQITASYRKNIVYPNMPVTYLSNTLLLNPQPLKIYRKEIASIPLETCNRRVSSKVFDYEVPGANIVNSNISDKNTNGLENTIEPTIPNISTSGCNAIFSDTDLETRCLSVQNNALRRVRSSGIIKRKFTNSSTINNLKYYPNSQQYLDSRNKTYDQNTYHHLRKGDATSVPGTAAATDNVYASNTVAHCSTNDPLTTNYVPVYYKPSNSKFAQQGGVSSSSRIQRLKYDTITDAGLKLQTIFGKETANALAYSTTNSSLYSLKQKVGYPNKQTPVFSKVTGELKCDTCVKVNISS
jgi:hypothetical protein